LLVTVKGFMKHSSITITPLCQVIYCRNYKRRKKGLTPEVTG
jgi:hypothetical protein